MIRARQQVLASTVKGSGLAILLLLLSVLSVLPFRPASAADEPKRVLLLFAEDQSFPLITTLGQSIRSNLNRNAASRIEFYTEHLDRIRIADDVYETELVNFWQKKYEGRKIDLIIVCVASAFDLLSRHREELFPGTPAVFCVLFEQEVSRIKAASDVTGV
ncbi:MAG TPA: hypothetical protein VLU47_16120, partial [Blastocatellia bacterium]|nr:hypothetical protein [Blastocatellia bacterium]